eukprot:CAMPEP_0198359118 /NCGR_PEP_ID=MMETSP1450-20131203/133387_1 /TAXON_ID=753684 ORGANISM="Madagascaria erythrocladiodes, Strain CCMP3234" /NCGR_SAMPLE_ID=MMETSP1450 /ASSEMBLY_ACC=CAM_ASM_001115 /LENGTH=48 /DNA_ID= /DNA_START= /DNA_END= /DNA_ORIENTATION=
MKSGKLRGVAPQSRKIQKPAAAELDGRHPSGNQLRDRLRGLLADALFV